MVPVFLVGAAILSSASVYVKSDISKVWTSTAAQAEVLHRRAQGEVKLLLVRNLDVGYDGVQVLFNVDFEIDEGEVVALLGTNGAGKSTLLKAIAGVVPADAGAIVFDGRDATYAPPHEITARGVVLVPGGQGTRREVENPVLIEWLRKVEPGVTWMTSVCTGSLLLCEAGFATGRAVTTHWAFVASLRERYPDVRVRDDVRYVRAGRLVTAAGVSAGIDMALWLTGQLWGTDVARNTQRAMQYEPAPPYAAEV
jgi:putative intracellular protease/amidase